jgi:hypothetical protein
VKWLRRMELSTRPFMTREETSKYTEALKGDKARQFSFYMDARSIITSPTYPGRVRPGYIEIRGIAWSGRGRIHRAELSFDEGHSWHSADLQYNPRSANSSTRAGWRRGPVISTPSRGGASGLTAASCSGRRNGHEARGGVRRCDGCCFCM